MWAMCMWGVGVGFSLSVPSFASVSAISLPLMPIWALTLCICTKCGVKEIWCIMVAMRILSGGGVGKLGVVCGY